MGFLVYFLTLEEIFNKEYTHKSTLDILVYNTPDNLTQISFFSSPPPLPKINIGANLGAEKSNIVEFLSALDFSVPKFVPIVSLGSGVGGGGEKRKKET